MRVGMNQVLLSRFPNLPGSGYGNEVGEGTYTELGKAPTLTLASIQDFGTLGGEGEGKGGGCDGGQLSRSNITGSPWSCRNE